MPDYARSIQRADPPAQSARLARYNPDGSLDTTFGEDGLVADLPLDYYARSVTVDNTGRILISGEIFSGTFGCARPGFYPCGALARFNVDGSLDASFDGDGVVISEAWGPGQGVALDSAGRIVVAAGGRGGAGSGVARYLSDGTPDSSFGSGGLVSTAFSARDIILDTAGRILTTGYIGSRPTRDIVTARFLANGSPDITFDGDGQAVTDFAGANAEALALAVDGSDRIVVAGHTGMSPSRDFAVVRYTPGGALDTTFDGDGKVTTDFAGTTDSASSVALDTSGRIVVAGYSEGAGFPVARYNPDGSLDTTFDGDGKVTTGTTGSGSGAALDGAGRIVVAGTASMGENSSFALVRYTPGGALDPAFDGDGRVITDFPGGDDWGFAVAVDNAGRIVVAGLGGGNLMAGSGGDFAVARYTIGGAPDQSFGNNGSVTTDIAGEQPDVGRGVAVDGSGRIVVAGYTGEGSSRAFAVARYNPDGSPDTSFDGDGKVTTSFGGGYDRAYAMVIDGQGRIVVAGKSAGVFALARYNPDGSLDTSFDGDGKVTTSFDGQAAGYRYGVAIDGLGRIVVAGEIISGPSTAGLARYTSNGALDVTFSGDGRLTSDSLAVEDVAIDGLDRIIVAGSSGNDFAVARYSPDGTLDTGFGSDGMVTTDFSGNDGSSAVALDGDGHIVVAGWTSSLGSGDFALARYHPDGSLDTAFGDHGKVTTDLGSNDLAYAMALDPIGRIVVAGITSQPSTGYDFAVARYLGGGPIRSIYVPVIRRR